MTFFKSKAFREFLAVAVIVAVGLWLKMQAFLYQTFAFTYDVGRDMLAVSSIVENFKIPLIGYTTGHHGIFYGPTWYYLLTPVYLVSFGDPRGIAFFMVLTGVATAIVGYLLAKQIGGNLFAIPTALFLSVSAILNGITSQIWNPNLIPFFIALFLYVWYSKWVHKKLRLFGQVVLSGILLGIIFDLEIVFGVLFALSFFVYLFLIEKIYKKPWIFGMLLMGMTIPQLPRVLFELRHDFLMTRALFAAFFSNEGDSLFTAIPNLGKVSSVLFREFAETLAWRNEYLAGIMLVILIGAIGFLFKQFTNQEKKFISFQIIIVLVFVIGLSFFNHDMESHYYVGISLVYILIFSFVLYAIKRIGKIPLLAYVVGMSLFAVVVNRAGILDTFKKNTWIGDASVYRNQIEVVDFIYKDANGKQFNTATYTPPIFDYPYQYHFKWYGKNNYGYVPIQDKAELFYLILEPDLQFPVRQEEWLKVREGDGVVVSKKEFSSGIIIQKRIH